MKPEPENSASAELTARVSDFLADLAGGRGFSPRTVEAYRRDLDDWLAFLLRREGRLPPPAELTPERITLYLAGLSRDGRSARTVARRLAALRSLARYLRRHGYPAEWTAGLRGPRLPRPVPAFLSEAEMERLFQAPPDADDAHAPRDSAVMELLYATGMRLAELVGLNRDDRVDLNRHRVRVVGKGNRERIIPFGAPAAAALALYLKNSAGQAVADQGGVPLFLGAGGRRLSRRSVQNLVRQRLSRVADRSGLSPHLLRHTMATHLLARMARGQAAGSSAPREGRAAQDIRAVQELLGHVSLSSTQVYTHVTVDRLRAALKDAHPRGEE